MGYIDKKRTICQFYRLSTEPKPTINDGAEDGSDLLIVDTGEMFVFYQGEWWVL